MKNNYAGEIILSILLIAIAVLLINPFMAWMPGATLMAVIIVFGVIFFVFASFVWEEKNGDERKNLHRLDAGHTAFLIGSGILTAGIIVQSISHTIDPWLVIALTAMLIGKIIAIIYRDLKN